MFVALIGLMGTVRLLVPAEACDPAALATLARERCELDVADFISIVGPTLDERYAALRCADIAVGFGRPLPDARTALDPLWFDIPVVAFDDPIAREAIEPCGLIVDERRPLEVAALLKTVARDAGLRQAMIAEGRRVRARSAPEAIASTVLESIPKSMSTI